MANGVNQFARAYVASPIITTVGAGQRCMEFFYNMHGSNIDDLHVNYIADGKRTTAWTRGGDQGINWHKVELNRHCHGYYLTEIETRL